MRTTPAHHNVFDFNALLHPGTVFDHPRDVVGDPTLSLSEKRAILASWASDASAVASCPALRLPEGQGFRAHRRHPRSAPRAGWKRPAQSARRQADAAALSRARRGRLTKYDAEWICLTSALRGGPT